MTCVCRFFCSEHFWGSQFVIVVLCRHFSNSCVQSLGSFRCPSLYETKATNCKLWIGNKLWSNESDKSLVWTIHTYHHVFVVLKLIAVYLQLLVDCNSKLHSRFSVRVQIWFWVNILEFSWKYVWFYCVAYFSIVCEIKNGKKYTSAATSYWIVLASKFRDSETYGNGSFAT